LLLNVLVFINSLSYFLHRYLRMYVDCFFFVRSSFLNLTYTFDSVFIGKIVVLKLPTSFILSDGWIFTISFFNLAAFTTFVISISRLSLLIILLISFVSSYFIPHKILFIIIFIKIKIIMLFWILKKNLTITPHILVALLLVGLSLISTNISA